MGSMRVGQQGCMRASAISPTAQPNAMWKAEGPTLAAVLNFHRCELLVPGVPAAHEPVDDAGGEQHRDDHDDDVVVSAEH